MRVRVALIGANRSRNRIALIAATILVLASGAFLLGYDGVLGFSLFYLSLAFAVYAGWIRAGFLVGVGFVFLTILWRFVFPPLIGYLRGSMALRYTPPRVLGYKLDPRGELVEGITHGPVYALIGAVTFGGLAYLVGYLVRRFTDLRAPGA